MIRSTVGRWQEVLRRDDVGIRPSEDVWSPLEYACHVRDVYALYDERLQMMLTQEAPRYPNWDQDVTSVEDRYAEQDPGTVSQDLAESGERLAARFDEVSGQAWERVGIRSDGAHFTVESFARYLIHDPLHHLYDVAG
jgi:predicted carbohydrate-binding protein with CBM5 and CBM33 domain